MVQLLNEVERRMDEASFAICDLRVEKVRGGSLLLAGGPRLNGRFA